MNVTIYICVPFTSSLADKYGNTCQQRCRQIWKYLSTREHISYCYYILDEYLCHQPSGLGRWLNMQPRQALVEYSVTFPNLWAGDKIFVPNILTITVLYIYIWPLFINNNCHTFSYLWSFSKLLTQMDMIFEIF